MSVGWRLLSYLLTSFAWTVWELHVLIESSRADLETDPSAMAWVGFLPFIAPIVWAEVAIYVAATAVVIELVIWSLGICRTPGNAITRNSDALAALAERLQFEERRLKQEGDDDER